MQPPGLNESSAIFRLDLARAAAGAIAVKTTRGLRQAWT